MNKEVRLKILKRLTQENPNPTTELNYNSTFELLIAVILSAQATDISVNKATKDLFQIANTPKLFLDLGVEKLKQYIKTIGLFNTKATNIIKTAKILKDKYQSQVPQTQKELMALPGVGQKTANVVLNTAFKKKEIAVDTHIFRVSNRLGFAKGKNVLEVEKNLHKFTDDRYKLNLHHHFILHGRYVCKARNPDCNNCILFDLCEFKDKNCAKL